MDPETVLGTADMSEGQVGVVPPTEATQEELTAPLAPIEGSEIAPALTQDPFAEEPVDLFSGVTSEGEPVAPSNPIANRRTAQLAAAATMGYSNEAGGIMNSVAEQTEIYLRQIESMGESSVRREIAAGRKADRLSALETVLTDNMEIGGDQALVQGSIAAYTNLAQLDANADEQWALERQAVERVQNLASAGSVTQARVMLGNLENGNALDVIRDYNSKQMILQSALDRAEVAQKDQAWFRDMADFVLSVVPLYSASRTGNVEVDAAVKGWGDSLFAGKRFKREAEALWDMSVEDLANFVNNGQFIENLRENSTLFGYTNNTEQVELLSGLITRTPSEFETNAWSALDIIGAVPWTKALKLGGGLTGMMVRTGARREASELTARAALDILQDSTEAASRTGMTAEGVARNLQVSAVAPEGSLSTVPIAVDAGSALERGRELIAKLPALDQQARLSAGELQEAVDREVLRLERQFGRQVKDVYVSGNNLSDGSSTSRVSFTIGRSAGDGFATEAQANRYMASIGETGGAIVDESGQWFARITVDVPEIGFYSNVLNVKTPSPARYVLNARNVGDINLADAGQVAGNTRNKMLKTLVEPYSNTFRSLGGRERDALAQVLQAGETQSAWFTKDQLDTLYQRRFNRPPSEKELAAYQAARDINDIEYVLRNDDAYKQRVIKGYRTGTFDTGIGQVDRTNMIVDRELKAMPKARIYDASTGRHYVDDLAMTPTQWERLKGKSYVLVTTEQAVKLADGTTVKNFLVKGKDITLENLRRDQIAYRAGGHRMYRGKYFVKQTVESTQPDTGRKFLDNPNTYIAAETRAEADFWASRMEAARLAHLNNADLSVIDEILGGHAGLPDAKEFVRLMDDPDGAFQKNTSFGTYYDREMPEEYIKNGQGLDFIDPDDTGFNGLLRTQGRMYTGRKGEQLVDYQGELAPLLDPYETINRSLMNIASLSSFGDYKIQSVERWMQTFGRYLDKQDIGSGLSDMRLFMEAPLAKGGNAATDRIREAAEAQRAIIKRTLGWKTPNDLRSDAWGRRMGDFVAGTRVDGALPSIRKAIATSWTQDANPISALRGFAFDLKLGMFNIAQLPMQLSTAFAATALSPKRGMQGWSMIAPMRFMLGGKSLSREAFEERLEQLAKNGVDKLGGFKDKAEFKDFTRAAMRSGFFDLGGTHGLMDHYGPSAALDGFNSGAKRVREAGRFFFYEAERWNRIVAWRIAWDEAVESGFKRNSPEFTKRLAGRAEEYSFNMSRESQAWWQKGLLSIPTQFWAYNARMLEAMTVGNFTPAQKLRLVASQSLLYGSAGLPLTGFISDKLKAETGTTPDIDSFWGTMDRGLIDRAVYEMTGADVGVGERYGSGGWTTELAKNLFGVSSYGEVSMADILGGATFNIMGKVGTDIMRPIVEYAAAESGDTGTPIRKDSLIRMATNISTVGNGLKAYMVFNYGTYISGTGTTLIDDLPPETAFAVALGIPPAEMDELTAMTAFFKNKSDAVKEASKVISNYRVDMLNRPDQRESIQEEVNAFVRLLPEDVRRDALEKAHSDIDPSLYASFVDRLEREQIEAERNGPTD